MTARIYFETQGSARPQAQRHNPDVTQSVAGIQWTMPEVWPICVKQSHTYIHTALCILANTNDNYALGQYAGHKCVVFVVVVVSGERRLQLPKFAALTKPYKIQETVNTIHLARHSFTLCNLQVHRKGNETLTKQTGWAKHRCLTFFLSLHRAFCRLFNYTHQHMHSHIYI